MVIMSFRNRNGILSFDEITFPKELNVGIVVIQITKFTLVIIIGFDPSIAKVGDLVVGVMQ
jgi:hypothetical protein